MNGMVKPRTYGRMGNFLFQAAAAMGYAWRHGMEFTLPSTTRDPLHNPIYLQHLVNPRWDDTLQQIVIDEKTHGYQELPWKEEWREKNIILNGYWQTEKYFKEFRDEVIEAMGYPWHPRDGLVSVHVRRGDYLRLTQKHPPVPVSWYEEAMRRFPGYAFRFFSDDIAWCKETFGHRSDVSFSEGNLEEQDLIEMSWCEHHICSASTFSWWGAWLNRNPQKRIIIPRLWFQPGYRKTDTKDIVPPEWERL